MAKTNLPAASPTQDRSPDAMPPAGDNLVPAPAPGRFPGENSEVTEPGAPKLPPAFNTPSKRFPED